MAQNLFYEDLNTGLESFTPVITKIDLALFENVGSVLASFTEFQLSGAIKLQVQKTREQCTRECEMKPL